MRITAYRRCSSLPASSHPTSAGIALAFVRLVHRHGARVLIADLKLTDAAAALVASDPHNLMFQETDVTDWSQLARLFTVSLERFGAVPDAYLPAAGLFEPPFANWWADNDDGAYKQLEVNAAHPMKVTRLALRALTSRNKKGVVCTIASSSGLMGIYTAPMYCASKHAIIGFTKAMAPADRIEGVRVVCLAPGDVNTPIWDDKREHYAEQLKSAMTPEYVAERILELMCKGSEYPGGTVYEVPVGAEPRAVPLYGVHPSPPCVDAMVLQDQGMDVKKEIPVYFDGVRRVTDEERVKGPWPAGASRV